MAQAQMTLKNFIRLHGTIHCTVKANDVFRKLFRRNIITYFNNPFNNQATLEADLRTVTVGLSLAEIQKLASIFQHEAERT